MQFVKALSDSRQDLPATIKLYTDTIVLKACGQEFKVMVYNNRAFDHQSMQQYALALADRSRAIALDEKP